jgi:hypothetical protein
MRSYTLERGTVNYWVLTLYEDGEPVGGGVGTETDYDDLQDVGMDFCETV